MVGVLSIFLLLVAGLATSVSALDIEITETEINGVEVFPDGFVALDLTKGDEIELQLEFTSLDDLDDVEILATILGSEEDIEEVLPLFDTREDTEYQRTVTLELPNELEQDSYRLLLIISDRDDEELRESFNIFVNSKRHSLAFEDVIVHPFGRVQAGDFLFAKVRLENFGMKDEDDVRVTASIAELGAQATSYIDQIEFEDQEETEEMLLVLPECAEAGQYRMSIVVSYNEGRDHLTTEKSVFVQENPACVTEEEDKEPAVVVIKEADNDGAGDVVVDEAKTSTGTSLRGVLEVVLLALVGLLVIVGLIIGVTKLRSEE
jgi:hypothetical protein